jgi:hypothetical protein
MKTQMYFISFRLLNHQKSVCDKVNHTQVSGHSLNG